MNKRAHITKSLKETEQIAREFSEHLVPESDTATVVFLKGDLGSGKTTFTKSLAKVLQIKSTVLSPTFILQKTYTIPNHKYYKKLIHIDAYRFNNPKEARVLDLESSIKDPSHLIIIEWPSKLGKVVRTQVQVSFISLSENSKKITW